MGNGFQLVRLEEAGAVGFKREMQKAFQYGYEVEFGPCAEVILPEEDIDRSLNALTELYRMHFPDWLVAFQVSQEEFLECLLPILIIVACWQYMQHRKRLTGF